VDLAAARAQLIKHLSSEIRDQRVLDAMAKIPRERFVPRECHSLAYEDRPLPIGWGQTISQPYIVALMTEALELGGGERVLELGTGSGYQAAILAELAAYVVTVERISPLADNARRVLEELGYRNVEVHLAGAHLGWPPGAPYDAIMVTAAARRVPSELMEQLAEGGRLVIPVGSRWEQELLKVVKRQGKELQANLGACRFVPLIGPGAWGEEESEF